MKYFDYRLKTFEFFKFFFVFVCSEKLFLIIFARVFKSFNVDFAWNFMFLKIFSIFMQINYGRSIELSIFGGFYFNFVC